MGELEPSNASLNSANGPKILRGISKQADDGLHKARICAGGDGDFVIIKDDLMGKSIPPLYVISVQSMVT
jgi:hypothetical protein